jgi:hypothetical protein
MRVTRPARFVVLRWKVDRSRCLTEQFDDEQGGLMLNDGERPRRPGKVILLVVAFWLVGTALQAGLRWLIEQAGLVDPDIAGRIGQAVGWGLLCVLSYWYRHPLDEWLRA